MSESVNIVEMVSMILLIAATTVLSVYFYREYFTKRLTASLAWAVAFTFYAFAQIVDFVIFLSGEIAIGKGGLAVGLIMIGIGMALFYYGTSLLFFSRGSFFREKIFALILVITFVYFAYLLWVLPVEGFRDAVRPYIQAGLMAPIFFIIAVLFYRVSRRLDVGDPRRQTILLVSIGWFGTVINAIGRALFLEISPSVDSLIAIIGAVAFLLIMYGMVLGKAART